jgi:hypothetical protein
MFHPNRSKIAVWIDRIQKTPEPKPKKIMVWRGTGGTKIDENHGLGSWSSLGGVVGDLFEIFGDP